MINQLELEHVNFEILALSFSVMQGQFAANKILEQCRHPMFNPEVLPKIKFEIEQTKSALQSFWQGEVFVSPERPDFPDKMGILGGIIESNQNNFINAAQSITEIIAANQWQNDPQNYQLLVAYFAWRSYCEDNYMRKLAEFYTRKNLTDLKLQTEQEVASAQTNLSLVSNFLKSIKSPEGPEPGFFPYLLFFAKTLPAYFHSKVHEYNLFKFIGQEEDITYEQLGFKAKFKEDWTVAGFTATEAGFWLSYNFKAEMAQIWRLGGFVSAAYAGEWYMAGFPIESARQWAAFGFTPLLTMHWQKTSYTPEHAAILISHGLHLPEQLPPDRNQLEGIIARGFKV